MLKLPREPEDRIVPPGPPEPRPEPPAKQPKKVAEGVWEGVDGKMYTDLPKPAVDAPKGMVRVPYKEAVAALQTCNEIQDPVTRLSPEKLSEHYLDTLMDFWAQRTAAFHVRFPWYSGAAPWPDMVSIEDVKDWPELGPWLSERGYKTHTFFSHYYRPTRHL